MAAAANDPGERGGSRAARWLLAPSSCGDQLPARVPRAAPRRSSLRLPLSLPGSFASLTMSAAGRPPWHGILVPTAREHHAELRRAVPGLRVHPVLGKWLYLPARHPEFEAVADVVAGLIADGDARIGVVPAPRRRLRPRKERFA